MTDNPRVISATAAMHTYRSATGPAANTQATIASRQLANPIQEELRKKSFHRVDSVKPSVEFRIRDSTEVQPLG